MINEICSELSFTTHVKSLGYLSFEFETKKIVIEEDTSFVIKAAITLSDDINSFTGQNFDCRLYCSQCKLILNSAVAEYTFPTLKETNFLFLEKVDMQQVISIFRNGIWYMPLLNFNGLDVFRLELTSVFEEKRKINPVHAEIPVHVLPLDDLPELKVSETNLSASEGMNVTISGIRIEDVDASKRLNELITTRFEITESLSGYLAFDVICPGTYLLKYSRIMLEVEGTLWSLNDALSNGCFSFSPALQWSGTLDIVVSLILQERLIKHDIITIHINSVYDKPLISISPSSVLWNVKRERSSLRELPISINVKALEKLPDDLIMCNVSVIAGLIISQDKNESNATNLLLVDDQVLNIVQSLSELVYIPPRNFSGFDSIAIACDDSNYISNAVTISIFIPPMRNPLLIDTRENSFRIKRGDCSSLSKLLNGIKIIGFGLYLQQERNLASLNMTISGGVCLRIATRHELARSSIVHESCENIILYASIATINNALQSVDICTANEFVKAGELALNISSGSYNDLRNEGVPPIVW